MARPKQSKAARNERRKALATTINAIGVAFLVAGVFQPVALGRTPDASILFLALLGFVAFQFALHYILARIED